MTPFETWCLLAAVFLGVCLIGKALTVSSFVITKKQPPAVRLSPDFLQQCREELIFNASKRVVSGEFGPRRKLQAGQSRRPL